MKLDEEVKGCEGERPVKGDGEEDRRKQNSQTRGVLGEAGQHGWP